MNSLWRAVLIGVISAPSSIDRLIWLASHSILIQVTPFGTSSLANPGFSGFTSGEFGSGSCQSLALLKFNVCMSVSSNWFQGPGPYEFAARKPCAQSRGQRFAKAEQNRNGACMTHIPSPMHRRMIMKIWWIRWIRLYNPEYLMLETQSWTHSSLVVPGCWNLQKTL